MSQEKKEKVIVIHDDAELWAALSTWPEDHPEVRFKLSKEMIEASLMDFEENMKKVKKD